MPKCVTIGDATLYLGDCTTLTIKADALICDPPYGCNNDCNYSRFSGGLSPSRNHHRGVVGDDAPFDPSPWLAYPKVILWGWQHYADRLPLGTVLVWCKKRDNQLGTFLSDCELAWQKGGKGVYLFRHVWHGFDRQSEKGKTLHPTQKPVALMQWCISRLKLPPGSTIFDPYMGSGPTALAALSLGHKFVGAEIDEKYFSIACDRVKQKHPGD